jgi:hypothetical protein
MRRLWLLGCVTALACEPEKFALLPKIDDATLKDAGSAGAAPFSLDERRAALDAQLLQRYAQRLAPMLIGRSLKSTESESLKQGGGASLPALLDAWTREPGFSSMARDWTSTKLKASGVRGDINLNLPGNLSAYLAKNRLPHSDILTANYCVDDAGNKTTCDTGAPFAAGVLATRAFLSNNASRFNLKRARTLLRTFGCSDYPLTQDKQPSLAREVLIPLFAQDHNETEGVGTFGNGFACYTCHSQFGAHAQPFVKFDSDGRYVAAAQGRQLVGGEQGRSEGKLFASHMLSPVDSAKESSQVFGQQVNDLSGVAKAYVSNPSFWTCSAGGLLGYVFGLAESTVFELPKDVLNDIVEGARKKEAQPSLAALAVEAFSHPAVVNSFR